MSAGKGDKPRPQNKKVFDGNYDEIVWKPNQTNISHTKKGKKTFIYKIKQP